MFNAAHFPTERKLVFVPHALCLALAAAAALAMSACSRPPEAPVEAYAAKVTAGTAGCTLASNASSTCTGPWRYTDYAATCQFTSTEDAKICPYPQLANGPSDQGSMCPHGWVASTTTTSYTTSYLRCGRKCVNWTPGCRKNPPINCTCAEWEPDCSVHICTATDLNGQCQSVANNTRYNLQHQYDSTGDNNLITAAGQVAMSSFQAANCECDYSMANVPVISTAANQNACGSHNDTAHPQTCTKKGSDCGTKGQTTAYSDFGLTLDSVKQSDNLYEGSPTCVTCDDLALADRSVSGNGNSDPSVNAKATCLLYPNLYGLDGNKANTVVQADNKTAELLLEQRGDQLSPDLRAQIEALEIADSNNQAAQVCGNRWLAMAPSAACAAALPETVNTTLDYSNGFTNATGIQTNGSAYFMQGALTLTQLFFATGAAFTASPQPIRQFATDFTFQLGTNADGITFTIQNNSATTIGTTGKSLGYGGIANSIAIKFDLTGNGPGTSSTGLYTGGAMTGPATAFDNGIDLHSGHVFHTNITYDGTTLTVATTDTVSNQTSTQHYPIDIPGTIHGDYGYVGFTGATEGMLFTTTGLAQTIQTWKLQQFVPLTTWNTLNRDMALCERIGDAHAANEVRAIYQSRCLATLPTEIAQLPAACANERTTIEGQYETFATQWLSSAFGSARFDFTAAGKPATNIGTIQNELVLINSWFNEQVAIKGSIDNALLTDMNTVLASFWNGINPGFGALNPNGPIDAATLDNASAAELEANREVLLALFQPVTVSGQSVMPLTSLPFVYIFGDALEPVWERLNDAIVYHDLGCRYADCLTTNRTDEMTDMWAMLGAFDDRNALNLLIAKFSNNTSHVAGEWQAVWRAVASQHSTLESVILNALGTPSAPYSAALLETTPTTNLPGGLLRLQRLVLDGKAKTQNFKATGSLSGQRANMLQTGLDKDLATQTSGFSSMTDLQGAVDRFDAKRTGLVQTLQSQLNNAGQQTALNDKLQQLISDWNDADQQIAALRHNTEVDDDKFGDFMSGWKTRANPGVLAGQYQVRPYQTFKVLPEGRVRVNQSVFPTVNMSALVDTTTTDVPTAGTGLMQPVAIPLKRGEVLHIATDNQKWAPTCALSSNVFPPSLPPIAVDPAALVGPEGYVLSSSGSGYSANGHQDAHANQDYFNAGGTFSLCANAYVGADTPWGGASISSSLCGNLAWGKNSSDTSTDLDSNGSEVRSSVMFTNGLRAPTSPVPDMPVGSLLIVAAPNAGAPATRTQVVASGNSAFVADADLIAYVVVNDNDCGLPNPNQGFLNVTITKLTPAGEVANVLGPLMADEISTIRNGKLDAQGHKIRNGLADYVAAAAFLPGDRQALESQSLDDLRNALATITNPDGSQKYTLSTIPPDLLSMYTTRIDYELARIDRAVQIETLRIKQRSIFQSENETRDELETAQNQARLYALQARWSLQALDGEDLRKYTLATAQFLSDNVYPFIRVRFHALVDPAQQGGLFTNGQPLPDLAALVNVDWRSELYDEAQLVLRAGTTVKTILQTTINNYTPTLLKPVALSIPRPSVVAACADPNNQLGCPLSNYDEVDLERATAFWSQLDNGGIAHFTIRPEDLYRLHGGNAVLSCTMSSPVVKNMQLFFNIGTDPASYGTQFTAPLRGHGDFIFTSDGGPEAYVMANQDWLTGDASVLFGQQSQVETSVNALLQNPTIHGGFGQGLSPFTSFRLDMSYYVKPDSNPVLIHPLIASMIEVVLVFETEYREVAAGVPYVGTCH
jgi:hypothetical protein